MVETGGAPALADFASQCHPWLEVAWSRGLRRRTAPRSGLRYGGGLGAAVAPAAARSLLFAGVRVILCGVAI